MSCCGKKRQATVAPAPAGSAPAQAPQTYAPSVPGAIQRIMFEYTGRTSMAVIGGVSRLRYTFIKTGARVAVDARDRASMAAIPNLKQLS